MEIFTTFTNPIVDAYINYQTNRDDFKKTKNPVKKFRIAGHMTFANKIFIHACHEYYSQPENLN